MSRPLRVSTISYLNTVPLTWSLLQQPPAGLQFDFTVPSECAWAIEHGRADIGIIPSIEYQRIPGLAVLGGPAIASRDEVRSILLLTSKPLDQIRTVAADNSSRTSLVLAELLLRVRYGVRPQFLLRAPLPAMMLHECDAAVIIGDPALKYFVNPIEGVQILDLVAEWRAWTGLPFVFAFWALPQELATPELAQLFCAARDAGLQAVEQYAPAEARRRGLPLDFVLDYLTRHIWYYLDGECLAGLQRFYELAAEHGFIHRVAPLKIVEPAGVAGAVQEAQEIA